MNMAEKAGVRLILPEDVIVLGEKQAGTMSRTVTIDTIKTNHRIVDIGPLTIRFFTGELKNAETVFWNGPMGINEIPEFATGTHAMAVLLSGLNADTIIGGGSTADVVTNMGLADKMTFISTGGGASLRFLSGKKLPGLEALLDKDSAVAAENKK